MHRKFDRHPVKVHAFVHSRGQFQSATVVDYSNGGLQLEGTFGLIRTDPIEIEFISGIRVPGHVAWSLGCQTGIVFLVSLPADHPVLIALLRRAGTHLSKNVVLALSTDDEQSRTER